MRGWIKKSESFHRGFHRGRQGARLTQCCLLHCWKAKPEQSIITKADSFFPDTLVGVGRRLKLLSMEKLQPRSSSRPFFSGLLEILPTLPEPILGRGQRCVAGDLSKGSSSRAAVNGQVCIDKGGAWVKFHLQSHLTILPLCIFSAETKLRPLQNEMCFLQLWEEPWEPFEKQSSLLVHLFTLSLVLQWSSLKLQHHFIISSFHKLISQFSIATSQTISLPHVPQKCASWILPFEGILQFLENGK